MRALRPLFLFLLVLLAGARCTVAQVSTDSGDGTVRILFIGNSLTYTQDVPGVVAGMAAAAGGPAVEVHMVAYPNFGLGDHWAQGQSGAARAAIREGWDVVVLQQGPSSLPESRALLLEDVARFAPEIRAAGGRPALYTVWPSLARFGDFPRVVESYRLAAESVNGLLLPAGEAWLDLLAADASVPLYGPDGFHQGPAGAYLAAAVIWAEVTGGDPGRLPARVVRPDGTVLELAASLAERLRAQATRTLAGAR